MRLCLFTDFIEVYIKIDSPIFTVKCYNHRLREDLKHLQISLHTLVLEGVKYDKQESIKHLWIFFGFIFTRGLLMGNLKVRGSTLFFFQSHEIFHTIHMLFLKDKFKRKIKRERENALTPNKRTFH